MTLNLKSIRRDLHRIPELGFELPLTSQYLFDMLTSMGYQPQSIAQTGWLVTIPGWSEDILMFRSDMDGLPILEKNTHNYKSTNLNMHACGHDAHMSMLLGLANELKGQSFYHTIVLLFQPAEESPGGARVVLEELPFEINRVKGCFGLHVYPQLDTHQIGTKPGPMMAQNGEIDIIVHGVATHAGTPHRGIDALQIASHLMQSLQTIISRNMNPLDSVVAHFGKINGGEARNALADRVVCEGTLRAFSQKNYDSLKQLIRQHVKAFEVMHGVNIECDIRDFYPSVTNDSQLFKKVENILGNQLTVIEPVMLAEDFGFYTQVMPSLFMFLGSGNPKTSLHSPTFDLDESILQTGVDVYSKILESFENKI